MPATLPLKFPIFYSLNFLTSVGRGEWSLAVRYGSDTP